MIEQIRLRNFRRYVDETFHFKSGVNVIEGRNNVGKTSILYAIEYAFFGKAGSLQPAALMHPKTRTVGVELIFRARDGVRYRLQRIHARPPRAKKTVHGHYTLKAQGPDDDEERYALSSDFDHTEKDLAQKLFEVLGISRRVFDVAVHLRQGLIAGILAGAPELDIVLGITAAVVSEEEMRKMALEREKAAAALPVLEANIARHASDLVERQATAQALDDEQEALSARQADLRVERAELEGATGRLANVDAACAGLEAALAGLDEARRGREAAAGRREELGEAAVIEAALARIEAEAARLEAARGEEREGLAARRAARRAADQRRGDLAGRLQRREHLPRGAGAVCDACGQPIDHAVVEAELPAIRGELEAVDAELAARAGEIEAGEAALGRLDARLAELGAERREQAQLGERHAAASAALAAAQTAEEAARQAAASRADALRGKLTALALDEAPEAPRDLARVTRAALSDAIDASRMRLVRVEADLENLATQGERLAGDSRGARERIAESERELASTRAQARALRSDAALAEQLRELAQVFKGLQQALRERATTELAEHTLALHGALSGGSKEFKSLVIDPKRYEVQVVPRDIGVRVPAHLYQGGGHRLLLGLAFKLAVAKLLDACPFILLDEPTYGLDAGNREALLARIRELDVAEQLILITHHEVSGVTGHRVRVARQGNTTIQVKEAAA